MFMKGNTMRFYVCLEDGAVLGPMGFREIQAYDAEALVCVEGGEVYWPRRRWNAKGELNVSSYEHCQAWVWLLAFAPTGAWFFAPGLIRVEWGVCWMMAIAIAFIGMCMSRRDVPRFPGE